MYSAFKMSRKDSEWCRMVKVFKNQGGVWKSYHEFVVLDNTNKQ